MLSPDPNPGKGPDQKRTVSEACKYGERAWRKSWQDFADQWTQPGLMKLAEAILGEKAIHSGQIGDFPERPTPKLLLSIGMVNLALAYQHGELEEKPEYTIPQTLDPKLWEGKRWLVMPDQSPMGPAEVFACVCGDAFDPR